MNRVLLSEFTKYRWHSSNAYREGFPSRELSRRWHVGSFKSDESSVGKVQTIVIRVDTTYRETYSQMELWLNSFEPNLDNTCVFTQFLKSSSTSRIQETVGNLLWKNVSTYSSMYGKIANESGGMIGKPMFNVRLKRY